MTNVIHSGFLLPIDVEVSNTADGTYSTVVNYEVSEEVITSQQLPSRKPVTEVKEPEADVPFLTASGGDIGSSEMADCQNVNMVNIVSDISVKDPEKEEPSGVNSLFADDMGDISICVIAHLLKPRGWRPPVEYPLNVHLIRGNYEAADINTLFGFRIECIKRMVENLQRPIIMEAGSIVLMDLLWSDPTENDSVEGLRPNARGPRSIMTKNETHGEI
ncbi:hypothetical protein POM88_041341 [Heracleum sosnowskyi]|uniref:Uncharacterized protein n=1 Tax=Heracleum sosnowskyi TaxID=360622 RepID=A0AAD8HE21_9APIA|nr:hypothetical protein POM88_041341 [Heracleum sosnowskyi]